MLTGKLPFPSDSAQETMIMRLTDKPKGLGEMKPDMHWPADVQAVMDKALERDANLRYQSASEFARDLVEAIDRMPAMSITTIKTHLVSARPRPATIVGVVPPTRVQTKNELARGAAGGAVAGNQGSSPSIGQVGGGGKSKVGMYVGAGVITAGLIGVIVIKRMGGTVGKDTPSGPTKAPASVDSTKPLTDPQAGNPTVSTQTANGDGALTSVDAKLAQLNARAEKDTTTTGATIIVNQIQGMASQLKTADQRVNAALIESMAQGVLDTTNAKSCAALKRVEKEAPNTKHSSEFASMYSTCKLPPE